MSPSQVTVGGAVSVVSTDVGFLPTDLPGLVAAWDFSDMDLITESGGLVSQVDGAYGTGYALTQGTGTKQPTTGTRTQNGLNVLDWNGGDDLLEVTMYLDQPFAIIVVAASDNVDSGAKAAVAQPNGATVWYGVNADTYRWKGVDSGIAEDAFGHVGSIIANGANGAAFIDGAAAGTSDTGTTPLYNWFVGGDNASGWVGWIAEVLVYNSALGTADRQAVETYLNAKWGI